MRALVLVLLGVCCLTWNTVQGVGSEVLERSICLSLTTKPLPVSSIRTYTIKEGPMKAVILITKRGLKICADPDVKWVKKTIRHINKSTRSQTKPTELQQPTNTAVTLTG